MDHKGSQMKRHKSVANQDIISDIPEVLKDKILCCLPIKEAVGTCLLSRKWRYTWASMTNVMFREDDFNSGNGNKNDGLYRFIRFTDMFLSLHNGPILKFGLIPRCAQMLSTRGYIDRWMLKLSRNGIKEIQIRTNKWINYRIPSCFFSCVELEYAYVSGCVFWLPPHFKGFNRLHTLLLQDICAPGNIVGDLVSDCPNLVKVILSRLRSFGDINISSTKLKMLAIDGLFEHLHLHTPHVTSAIIKLRIDTVYPSKIGSNFSLSQLLGSLLDVENIVLLGRIFKCVARGHLPLMLPTPFNGLTEISLMADLGNLNEAKAALCLFQNAPNLRHIKLQLIWVSIETTTAHFWESIDHQVRPFHNLDAVSLDNFSGSSAELGFVKLILGNAPVLREVRIREDGRLGKEAFKNLLKMRRTSKDAEVMVL